MRAVMTKICGAAASCDGDMSIPGQRDREAIK